MRVHTVLVNRQETSDSELDSMHSGINKSIIFLHDSQVLETHCHAYTYSFLATNLMSRIDTQKSTINASFAEAGLGQASTQQP